MESIAKINLIQRNSLDQAHYFTSLLAAAVHKGLVGEDGGEQIQIACFALLAQQTQQYTHGESSSVTMERAESLLESLVYTMGVYLKSFPNPDDAVEVLLTTEVKEIYRQGRQRVAWKLQTARHLHYVVLDSLLETENEAYNATLVDGVGSFFKIYNPDFAAQDSIITLDYPLANPQVNLVGVELVEKYLEAINYENKFCHYFVGDKITALLTRYDADYEELIFNIFEQVLTVALGCVLAQTPAVNLTLTVADGQRLAAVLTSQSAATIEQLLAAAGSKLVEELGITNPALVAYLTQALVPITATVVHAVAIKQTAAVFLCQQVGAEEGEIYFSLGRKMDDKQYRRILEQISQCRLVAEKVAIIKNNIKSLADLEDIFFDAYLSSEELGIILAELDPTEIAALAKRHPYQIAASDRDLSEVELNFRHGLNQYIRSLPQDRQIVIAKTMEILREQQN